MEIVKIADAKTLNRTYPGQTNSQPVYIELNCKHETLTADYNTEIGNAVPFDVYHGHVQRFSIPLLKTDDLNALLDEIAPLAERVIDGYESVWNGNNHVARFSDDARAALEEIEELCDVDADETNTVQVWDIGNWLDGTTYYKSERDGQGTQCKWNSVISVVVRDFGVINPETTDEELSEIESLIEADAETNDVVVEDIESWLTELRDQCRKNAADQDED